MQGIGAVPADEAGLLIAPLDYVCRCCENVKTVFVHVEEEDGQPVIDGQRVRLERRYCDECATTRTFVAEQFLADDYAG